MRPLNNPWVVGGLALAAAGMVAYQTFQPRLGHPVGGAPPATASRAPTPAPKLNVAPQAKSGDQTSATLPLTIVETNYFESHMAGWAESAQHDPFHLLSIKPIEKLDAPSPVPTWKLKAVWQQEGKPLAAINKGLYREGDSIEGYKIIRIEDSLIWFQGAGAVESLGFPKRTPRVATTKDGNSLTSTR